MKTAVRRCLAAVYFLAILKQDTRHFALKLHIGYVMKKLQFMSHHPHNQSMADREALMTQEYVAALLFKQLGDYGFDAQQIDHADQNVAVRIINQRLPLSVICQSSDATGQMMCEISADRNEQQDWFEKIEMQSVMRQLAHAIENSLKSDHYFSCFEWKN